MPRAASSSKNPLRPFTAVVGGSLDGILDTKATRAEFLKAVQRIDAALEIQNREMAKFSASLLRVKVAVDQGVTKEKFQATCDSLWEEIKGDRVTLRHLTEQMGVVKKSDADVWAANEKVRVETHKNGQKNEELEEMIKRLDTNAKIDYQKVSEIEERVQHVEKELGIDYFGEYGNSDVDRDDYDYDEIEPPSPNSDHRHTEKSPRKSSFHDSDYENVSQKSSESDSDDEEGVEKYQTSSSGSDTDDSSGDHDTIFSQRGGGGSRRGSFDTETPNEIPSSMDPASVPKW
jgi:hypothetical protein